MKKFWYNFNDSIFKISLVVSIVLTFIVSIIISVVLSTAVGGWALLIWILILVIGILIVLEMHSLWGLIIEFVGTVYIIKDDLQTIKDSSEKNEDTDNITKEIDTQPLNGVKRCSCGAPLKENDIVCLRCGKTVESLLKDTVQEKKMPTSTSTWKCLKCNSVNPDTAYKCRVCKRPRWTKEFEKWVCTYCDNLNSGNNDYCAICGSHRGNAQPQTLTNTSDPPTVKTAVPSSTPTPAPKPVPQKWTCSCGSVNNSNANFCFKCGKHR